MAENGSKVTPEQARRMRSELLATLGESGGRTDQVEVESYRSVIEQLYPEYFASSELEPHLDVRAVRMNELRGLILGQSTQMENALLKLMDARGIEVRQPRTAGNIVKAVHAHFEKQLNSALADDREVLDVAVLVRNRVAHDHIEIGSLWRDYGTGGGEWVPVISLLGAEEYDEKDMLEDLEILKAATRAAVRVWAHADDWTGQLAERARLE